MALLYGWGKRGEPLVESVPARRGKNLSVRVQARLRWEPLIF